MKALGCNSAVEPDVMCKGFLKDDILFMCSDGLTNMLRDNEIYREYYYKMRRVHPERLMILDNSAYEFFIKGEDKT
jgi:serine/threonine protein phosphatase PrpC